MFRQLHRLCVAIFWLFWLGVGGLLYQHRAAFEPALDFARVCWDHDWRAPQPLPEMAGHVTRVFNGASFQFRDSTGPLYNFGLAGVEAPRLSEPATLRQRRLFAQSARNLEKLLGGQSVRIAVALVRQETHTGLGLVWANQTNINRRVIAEGEGSLDRGPVFRSLPLREAYALVRAERRARRRGVGLWSAPQQATQPLAERRP